ncbi:hypothetical protein BC834DRAFT_311197 [Gloeopeniophorella convolvens]|nr:hypothetical protein BC834DRAFT_311197 [Gloeopeniophorella convolvens]
MAPYNQQPPPTPAHVLSQIHWYLLLRAAHQRYTPAMPSATTTTTAPSNNSTLTITFGVGKTCHLPLSPPAPGPPVHIHAALQHPLVGLCAPLQRSDARVRRRAAPGGTQRNVFAAALTYAGASAGAPAGWPARACLKYAAGREAVAALRREEAAYRGQLAPLAGVAVPEVYGLFVGGTPAAPVGCLVMELCVSEEKIRSTDEFCRLAMLTLCKVHAAGIMHNTPLDLRHFVMKGKQVFLVDYSKAVVHPCAGAYPNLVPSADKTLVDDELDEPECLEMLEAERSILYQLGEKL